MQLALFRVLPGRVLSRTWGSITAMELPRWCRRPVLGLYVWLFACKMEEALVDDVKEYSSLLQLFTRELKDGARNICDEHTLVSYVEGTQYNSYRIEQDGMYHGVGTTCTCT